MVQYLWQHINTILETYDGTMPLVHFLKHYLRQHPKLGSRDRRMISTIAYSWYRCAKGLPSSAAEDRATAIASCLALCGADMSQYSRLLGEPTTEEPIFDIERIFPYDIPLSAGIGREGWLRSMLTQPDLFIRLRDDGGKVMAALDKAGIIYTRIGDSCLALPNGTAADKLLPPASYVVQDASSQETGIYFNPRTGERWYDCCSGAGGKSLLLMDKKVPVALTASDKRASILHNLTERFRLYGHKPPRTIVADAGNAAEMTDKLGAATFNHIICDVPCSGSGTWARTPEQMYFFDPGAVSRFASLQYQIATNATRRLERGGSLIYITCSVFRQENEDVAGRVAEATGLSIMHMGIINGIARRSDSMFVAVLQ